MDLKKKLKSLPSATGVYLFKDCQGKVIYCGKAISLRKRVPQHFKAGSSAWKDNLRKQVAEIEYILTSSEAEALILENALIKQWHPLFNVAYRDDKSYPYLALTAEKFPRLLIVRRKDKQGLGEFYGPYANAKVLRQAVEWMRKIFPLRTCRKLHKSPCLNFHLKQCLGVCVGKVGEREYAQIVQELRMFLQGGKAKLLHYLQEIMKEKSAENDFEAAARLRDRIQALAQVGARTLEAKKTEPVWLLKEFLGLENLPMRIEAFDISNLFGKEAVGSMVYFSLGKADKNNYRRFKIKSISGIDDYAMISEVLSRRYKRLLKEKKPLPDLILIDGGKGHLETAKRRLENLGLRQVPVFALAKQKEEIFFPDGTFRILAKDSPAGNLLKRIRNEAHRFALSYYRHLKNKSVKTSGLREIPGIGAKRTKALLERFSLEELKTKSVEELAKIKGMTKKAAEKVVAYFK
jgi:excinuclease ABC subunit C